MAQSVLEEARRLNRLGFGTLPTRRGKKSPGLPSWQKYQQTRPTLQLVEAWWGPGSQYSGIWVPCGSISQLVVLDTDSPEAEEEWRSLIGAEMDATCCVKTQKGYHYWFSLAPGDTCKSWAVNDGLMRFDVKAEGGGVMAPPSPHPDGGFYEWVREPVDLLEVPSLLVGGPAGWSQRGKAPKPREAKGEATEEDSEHRSILSKLLAQTPDEGGRNNWLTAVCGHYARIIPYHDTYTLLVDQANASLAQPLQEAEVRKTAQSLWKAEKAKGFDTVAALQERGVVAGTPDETNGWLVGTGKALLAPALVPGEGKSKEEALQPWADFDIQVLGVLVSDETTDYLIKLVTTERTIECRLDGRVLGVARDLVRWLAERQCCIIPPVADTHGKQSSATRLLLYVKSQDAPTYKTVDSLGWSDEVGGFLVHEGIIRAGADRAEPFGDVRPNPILTEWAPYRYGFTGTKDDAQAVLREVLTFHDETVTAVYGAWWAACYLKVQIMAESSLFPFMALEAPSESGKTTGFFALMVQLQGNHEGHGEYTMAALRDRVSGHRNGLVWIDDMSDPTSVWDLVRQTTSEGSRTKKQQDRHSQERISLVAPIVISAEGLSALATEKALSDRAVRLSVPSPTSRMSLRDPKRPQWDDIKDLQARYHGELSGLAGWLAALSLECLGLVDELRVLRVGTGRHGDKLAILRLGARILAHMAADDSCIERVDAWCEAQTYTQGDNILTTEILPRLWRYALHPRSIGSGVPIFVDEHMQVHYNEPGVADQWADRRDLTPRQKQLGSQESLKGQRRDLGIEGAGRRMWDKDRRRQLSYHVLPDEIGRLVIERSGFGQGHDQGVL